MLSDYYSLNTICEFICAVIALICLRKDKALEWRLLVVLMIATFISETAGKIVFMNSVSKSNHWVYNIFILFQLVIMNFMFAYLFKRYAFFKKILISGIIILGLCYAFDMYNEGFFKYSNHTFSVMSVLFVLYSLIYNYVQFQADQYVDLRFSPEFWWTVGVLFYFLGVTACNLFDDELYSIMFYDHHLTYYIFRVLNILLYGFWSYSYICRKWRVTTT